jgi:diguanylate cyclase (GGDEF)-like protein
MADVDHFKRFNDRYGHDAGDQVLRMVAARLGQTGSGARAFRYGGEEFALLFPGCSAEEAVPHLETLRARIAGSTFALRRPGRPARRPEAPSGGSGAARVKVTISLGVADSTSSREGPAAVLKAADRALYRAKREGRNRVRR